MQSVLTTGVPQIKDSTITLPNASKSEHNTVKLAFLNHGYGLF